MKSIIKNHVNTLVTIPEYDISCTHEAQVQVNMLKQNGNCKKAMNKCGLSMKTSKECSLEDIAYPGNIVLTKDNQGGK